MANTIKTNSVAKLLFLVSQGEIQGFQDSVNPLKNVYFNNTQVQNDDGSWGINQVELGYRYGTATQTAIAGFPASSAAYNVGTKVTVPLPFTYTTSNANVDAIRVTVRFLGLYEQGGDGASQSSVNFKLYTQYGANPITEVRNVTVTEQCNGPFDLDYLIQRPAGSSSIWKVEMARVTPDNISTTVVNDCYFQIATEIQNVNLTFPKSAVVSVKTTSENTGTTIPTMSFKLQGLKVAVPSIYTVSTRTYSSPGTWDGTFKSTKEWCNNPVWCLYEVLTNSDWGMGSIITADDIDQYSFLAAAQYCDQLVPALNSNGVVTGTEPRYTFNYQYMANTDPWQFIQNMAATFGAAVFQSGGLIKIIQERPITHTRIFTNSNVEGGLFEYTSTQLSSRFSSATVWWNDPSQNWLSVPAYYEDATAIARYNYSNKEVTGIGVSSYGQAMRLAKSIVESAISCNDVVTFKVGYSNATIEVGEVVAVSDTYSAMVEQEAKIVSTTASTVTLDRAITVSSGNAFEVVGSDGQTLENRTITSTGTLTTISFSGAAITAVAGSPFVVFGNVVPRQYRVTGVTEVKPGQYTVTGQFYDPNKFARIDNTPSGPTPVYAVQPDGYTVSPVTNLTYVEEAAIDPDGTPHRYLTCRWSPVAGQIVTSYKVNVQLNGMDIYFAPGQATPYVRVDAPLAGTYKFTISAINSRGKTSIPVVGTYALTTGTGTSSLSAVTGLTEASGGGTTFKTQDLTVTWTNPSSNVVSTAKPLPLKDFFVQVIDPITTSVLHSDYAPAVPAGSLQKYSYTYTQNTLDGGPRRSVQVKIQCRDTSNKLSVATTVTFTNPAPAIPSNLAILGGIGSINVTWDKCPDSDYVGTLVWMGTTTGFTPSAANLVSDGNANFFIRSGLTAGTTYYVHVAHYDTFGKSLAGTGLNVSGELSAVASASAGIPSGSTLPGTAALGDLFFLTTDNKLYRWNGTAWVSAVTQGVEVFSGTPGTGNYQGRVIFNTVDNKLYTYNGTAWSRTTAAADIAGQITTTQITDGAISTPKLSAGSVTTANIVTGAITSDTILAGAVTLGKLATDSVDANAIIANSITGGKIAASTITGYNIAGTTITGSLIAANTLTADKINSNGLSIKDTSGNIILNAGSTVASSTFGGNATGTLNGTAVSTVVSNASAALSGVNAINDDNTLTPSEKVGVIQDYGTLTGEQADIDAKLTAFGLTSRKASYDAAIAAVTTALTAVSANGPVSWNNTSGNTLLTGYGGVGLSNVIRDAFINRQWAINDLANTAQNTGLSAVSSLTTKLNSNAQNILAGSGGLSVGSLAWDAAGNRTSGYGIGFTAKGMVGYNTGGSPTFTINTTGDAYFGGTLGANIVTASNIQANTITTDRLVANAATVASDGNTAGAAVSLTGTYASSGDNYIVAFTGTGNPTKVFVQVSVYILLVNANTSATSATVSLYPIVEGVGYLPGLTLKVPLTTSGASKFGYASLTTVGRVTPGGGYFRHYGGRTDVTLDSNGGASGYFQSTYTVVAEENKV